MLALDKTLLREPREEDLPLLHRLRNDLNLQMELGHRPKPAAMAQVRHWVEQTAAESTTVMFIVAEAGSERGLGFVKVVGIDPVHGFGHLRIALDPVAQGRGHGGQTLTLIERYVADVFGLRKLILTVVATNETAIRRYAKSGYREVGRHQAHWYFRGAWHDVLIMERPIPHAR